MKKTGDISKKDLATTIPTAHSPIKHLAFPTSSLEMIAFSGEEIRKKKKAGGKSFLPTFWDDTNAATLKDHEALLVDDLSPLIAKPSSEVMLSHIQKLVQVCAIGHLCFFFFLCLTSTEENFLVGFGGVPIRFWEALGFRE